MSKQEIESTINPSSNAAPQSGPFAKEDLQPEEKVFEGATKHTMKFNGKGKE